MKKILILFLFISAFLKGYSQYSSIVLNIKGPNERVFLDTVEAKLIRHIKLIQKHKHSNDLDLYEVSYSVPGIWSPQLKDSAFDGDMPTNERVATYRYRLDFTWDSTLTNGYVFGLSKLYCIPTMRWNYGGKYSVSNPVESPLYYAPLRQYNTFLTKAEISKLYSIIRMEFIRYVDDDSIYMYDSSLTTRTMVFNKSDSLGQMPWRYWVNQIWDKVLHEEFKVYNNSKRSRVMGKEEAKLNFCIFVKIIDEEGRESNQGQPADDFKGIIINENWKFDTCCTEFYLPYGPKPCIKLSRTIETIGIIKQILEGYEKAQTIGTNPIWIDANEVDLLCKKYPNLRYYRTLINSALFKKLKLKYGWEG